LGTIVHALADRVKASPERTAVICGPEQLTYGELWSDAGAIAAQLRGFNAVGDLGLSKVAVVLANGLLTAPVLFGIMATGARAEIFNPNLPPPQLPTNLAAAKPQIIICDATTAHGVNSVAKREAIPVLNISLDVSPHMEQATLESPFSAKPDSAALCRDGDPEPMTHSQLLTFVSQQGGVSAQPATYLNANPLYDDWGLLNGTLVPIAQGGTLVTVPRFGANGVLKGLTNHNVHTFSLGSGSLLRILVGDPLFKSLEFPALEITQCEQGSLEPDAAAAWVVRTGSKIVEL